MRPTTMKLLGGLLLATLVACSADAGTGEGQKDGPPAEDPNKIFADIRGDSNRDGEIKFDESDADKMTWDAKVGAIFLANIDDDEVRCKKEGDDITLAKCNDAADDVVNGPDDALDIARVKTKGWPTAPPGTTARIEIETETAIPYVRLFKKTGEADDELTVIGEEENVFDENDVRNGIEFGIEAKDVVRDPKKWDGYVVLRFVVTTPAGEEAEDRVTLRVSPVMTFHHLLAAEKVFVSDSRQRGNAEMRADLAKACSAAKTPLDEIVEDDPWTQDFFETGYMSMPGKNGTQHAMRVNFRSANVFEPADKKSPLRPAGQYVFKARGKDVAGIQQFDVKHDQRMDSLNSFGNYETVPPYELGDKKYPLGRSLRGKTKSFFPDPAFTKMMDAQGMQPAIDIDTSWLLVGHVDETLSFVHAGSKRGWVLLANDARLAKKMLEEQVSKGKGDVPMFVGKSWYDFEEGTERPAEISISKVLEDTEVMKASAEAAAEVDAQVAIIKKETGLTDDEIVHVPFLHSMAGGASIAYQPGIVNGVYVGDKHFAAPDPHGPVIDGKDIFKEALVSALAPHGITVHWVEDWEGYHLGIGEVHCGTNAARKIPDIKWWETGR